MWFLYMNHLSMFFLFSSAVNCISLILLSDLTDALWVSAERTWAVAEKTDIFLKLIQLTWGFPFFLATSMPTQV